MVDPALGSRHSRAAGPAARVVVALFRYLGQLVDLARKADASGRFVADHGPLLPWMGFVALVLRPLVVGVHALFINQSVTATLSNLNGWQNRRHVLRPSLGFFQNDFAGRIGHKVMQSGGFLAHGAAAAG